jgi:heme-degrading monooxygenase HmoA
MTILMKADVRGQTREGYQQVFDELASQYAAAPGFIVHLSHPTDEGWCVMDVWKTRKDCERFFREHVAPKLPTTVRPKITFVELHDVLALKTACASAA